MKIGIFGTGAMGGIIGAAFAQVGHNVTFIARGAHLAAIRQNGLRIEGDRGEFTLQNAQATDSPAEAGPQDVLFMCVKQWDLDTAAIAARPMVGPHSTIIPVQNGIDAADRLAAVLGQDRVMPGSVFITGAIAAPGVIRQIGTFQRVTFGERDGSMSPRGQDILKEALAGGLQAHFSEDIELVIWDKFSFLVPHSSMTAATRLPLGKFREDAEVMATYEAIMSETVAVGRARGVNFPPDQVAKTMAFMRTLPPHHISSMAVDVIRGNRIELPWLAAKVVELGRTLGVPTPATAHIYAALKPHILGTPA